LLIGGFRLKAGRSGVRQLAAAFAQASLLAVPRNALPWRMWLRASSPDQSSSKLRHSEPGNRPSSIVNSLRAIS
jgi:hypothetical protein